MLLTSFHTPDTEVIGVSPFSTLVTTLAGIIKIIVVGGHFVPLIRAFAVS
jgi:hypothetical protein